MKQFAVHRGNTHTHTHTHTLIKTATMQRSSTSRVRARSPRTTTVIDMCVLYPQATVHRHSRRKPNSCFDRTQADVALLLSLRVGNDGVVCGWWSSSLFFSKIAMAISFQIVSSTKNECFNDFFVLKIIFQLFNETTSLYLTLHHSTLFSPCFI